MEEFFGWAKTVGGLRKTRFIGLAMVKAQTIFTWAAYNLMRMATIFGLAAEYCIGGNPSAAGRKDGQNPKGQKQRLKSECHARLRGGPIQFVVITSW